MADKKYAVKFGDVSVIRKMLIILLGTFLIPLFFVSIIMVWYIGFIEAKHESSGALAVLKNMSQEFEQTFLSASDFCDLIVIKGLMGRFSGFHESARDYIALADYADDYMRQRPIIKSILLIRNGRIVFERGPALDSDIPQYPEDIKRAELSAEKSYWAPLREMNYFFKNDHANNEVIPFYKMISYNDSPSVLFVLAAFEEAELFKRYTSYNRGEFFLLGDDFYILSSTERERTGGIYPEAEAGRIRGEEGYFRMPDGGNLVYTRTCNGWYLVNHIPRSRFNINTIGYFVIILLAVVLGICFTFRRLNDIVHEMYITKIYNQEATLRMLTSQINPHFLYNTLDSIRWKALKNKDDEVAGQIEALADMWRLTLSKGNDIVTVEQEIKQLETYLFIINFRYRNRIKCSIIAGESVKQCKVPKLILQPIVENSILHGIEPKIDDGEITVHIENRAGLLYIIITDNGCGTDGAAINAMLKNREVNDNVFALKNIDQRIKLRYGEEYGLRFESEAGKGTVVTLVMPFVVPQGAPVK